MQGMTSEQVAQVLRNCGNSVRMLVARAPVGAVSVTPPTPAALPVALPAVVHKSPSAVSMRTILSPYVLGMRLCKIRSAFDSRCHVGGSSASVLTREAEENPVERHHTSLILFFAVSQH